ncbi:MAG: hypothetical protein IKA30_05200, partial [Alphaproteobacteria bacterium]|nr:hypothetical protein [Alphaproteobacteria bacterium]
MNIVKTACLSALNEFRRALLDIHSLPTSRLNKGENMGILTNSVSLLGKVGKYKECKCFETGGMVTTINFGVKTGEKWNNFFIDFFNTKTRELATEVGDKVKEGE